MPDFSNSKNKFKINNPYGEGSHDTSSKHGTNANYKKAGAPGFFGNLAKGKGLLGLLNPMGAIASKIGGKAEKVLNPASMLGGGGAEGAAEGATQVGAGTPPPVDPNAAPVDPNAVDPNTVA